jgi:Spy/CpxP family protein refolding chaperone
LQVNPPFETTSARVRGCARILALLAVAGVFAAAPAAAQTVKETLDARRLSVESQRRILVSGALPLTDAEAKAFWPLYDDYEKERRSIEERANRLVADFVAKVASLSDGQAKAMLAEALRVDEARVKLSRDFMARMAKAIPPRKLVRFYQIENKLDAAVRADIAGQIPLAP